LNVRGEKTWVNGRRKTKREQTEEEEEEEEEEDLMPVAVSAFCTTEGLCTCSKVLQLHKNGSDVGVGRAYKCAE
jgi:hypothetical protein